MSYPLKPSASLSGMLGETPYDHEEILSLRRRAWIEQGVVILSISDSRIGRADRERLIRLAEAFYGTEGFR